jgi:hypothetical protein
MHMQVRPYFSLVTQVMTMSGVFKCGLCSDIFSHPPPPQTGIPLTIQSNRPSSRSSQRSISGSIGSYGRRSSGVLPSKGVNVSQSRQGSARSAAILLYSHQLTELRNPTQSSMPSMRSYSDEFMAQYIEQQLETQKRLLYLEIPGLRNYSSFMRKLRLNPRSEIDLTQLDVVEDLKPMLKARKLKQKFFMRQATATTAFVRPAETSASGDVRSDNDENLCLNSESQRTEKLPSGFSNPLAYSLNDLDDEEDDNLEDFRGERSYRKYLVDNEDIFIEALPSPASEAPSIAVMIDRC